MKITPLEIRQKSFEKKALGGIDKDEVQGFLDSLSRQWEKLLDENRQLGADLTRTEADVTRLQADLTRAQDAQKRTTDEVAKLREVESSLYRTLKTADDTGRAITAQATAEADALRQQAEADTTALREAAQQDAEQLRAEAQKALAAAKTEADQTRAALQQETDKLRAAAQQDTDQLRAATQAETGKLTAAAKEEADRLRASAKAEAERLEAESTATATALLEDVRREVDTARIAADDLLRGLDQEKQLLQAACDRLITDLETTAYSVLTTVETAQAARQKAAEMTPANRLTQLQAVSRKPQAASNEKLATSNEKPATINRQSATNPVPNPNKAPEPAPTPLAAPHEQMELLNADFQADFTDTVVARTAPAPGPTTDSRPDSPVREPKTAPPLAGLTSAAPDHGGIPEIQPLPNPATVPSPMAPIVPMPHPDIPPTPPAPPVEQPLPEITPIQPVQPPAPVPSPNPSPTPAPTAQGAAEKSFFDDL